MVRERSTKILSFIMAVVMTAALSCVFCFEKAHAESYGDWEYTVISDSIDVTGYIGIDTAITVPAKINGKTVYSVSGLRDNRSKSRVTSVTLSSGIKAIGEGLFSNYTALTRVGLPETLVTIGSNAFFGCTALTGITIPSSVTTIGESAFMNCTALSSADLTSRASELPAKLFDGCTKLTTVTLPLYITNIGASAFNNCSSLTTIVIPDGVKTIGANAFANCAKLANVNLPAELKTIDEAAFMGCSSLKSVFFPNKVRTITESAFKDCTGLTEIYVSPSVTVIQANAFAGCNSLDKAVFGGEYVNITNAFDVYTNPEIFYAGKYASSWESFEGMKTMYSAVVSMSITGTEKLNEGKKTTLKISAKPSNTKFGNIYSLSSSNTSIATVNSDGLVTARKAGNVTITATSINGTTGTFNIKVVPASPENLTAKPKSTSSIELTWKDTGATGYYVYRSTSKSGTYKKIDTVLGTSYTDKGLTKGKTYYYKIAAYVTSDGKKITSGYSEVKSANVTSPTPTSVTATKAKKGVANIKWAKSNGAAGYEVYMATSKNGKYSLSSTINSGSTLTYKKSGLTGGKTYYFKVRSYIVVSGKKVYSPYSSVVKVKV